MTALLELPAPSVAPTLHAGFIVFTMTQGQNTAVNEFNEDSNSSCVQRGISATQPARCVVKHYCQLPHLAQAAMPTASKGMHKTVCARQSTKSNTSTMLIHDIFCHTGCSGLHEYMASVLT